MMMNEDHIDNKDSDDLPMGWVVGKQDGTDQNEAEKKDYVVKQTDGEDETDQIGVRGKEDTVKLISAEGFEFVIDRKAAFVSKTLKAMLTSSSGFIEAQSGEVRLPEIRTPVLEKICQYFNYALGIIDGNARTEFILEPELTLELVRAANYLDC